MNSTVQAKLDSYPSNVKRKLLRIRKLILEVGSEDEVGDITETLKWGEPSYLVKTGSTLRMDWKPKSPDQYAIYFNCKTTLIETIKEVYGDIFRYEGNRAIVFSLKEKLPVPELKACISLSLRYHQIKHLPLLGA